MTSVHHTSPVKNSNPLASIDQCIDLFFIIDSKNDEQLKIWLDTFHAKKEKAYDEIELILKKVHTPHALRREAKRAAYSWLSEYQYRLKKEMNSESKKGHDMKMEKMVLSKVPFKLKLFFITGKKRDAFKVYLLLEKVHTEMIQKVHKKFYHRP